MINVKIIILLSLAAYVTCGVGWSNKNVEPQITKESPEQEPVESNVQDQVVDIGEMTSSSSNTPNSCSFTDGYIENWQFNDIRNPDIPKLEDSSDKVNSSTVIFNNAGGNTFTQMDKGRQVYNQGNLDVSNYISDNTEIQKMEDSDDNDNCLTGGNTITQMSDGEQSSSHFYNQGNLIVSNYKSDGKIEPQITKESQEPVESNVQDQVVDIGEMPSSSSNTPNSCSFTDDYIENQQFNNFRNPDIAELEDNSDNDNSSPVIFNNAGRNTFKQMDKGRQVYNQGNLDVNNYISDGQNQGDGIGEMPSSSSNTEKDLTIDNGLPESAQIHKPDDTASSFEKDDLILIYVASRKPSKLYWMVAKKDGQCPEPKASDVLRVIKPSESVYNDVLNRATKTENENEAGQEYVHYKYFTLLDRDEPVSPVSLD